MGTSARHHPVGIFGVVPSVADRLGRAVDKITDRSSRHPSAERRLKAENMAANYRLPHHRSRRKSRLDVCEKFK